MQRSHLLSFMRERGIPLPPDRPRIAIVDDDPTHVDALARLVEQQLPEAEVKTAYDGFRGGMLVTELRPHVLFLDYMMPGANGADVCRTIRANPDLELTRIIIVSGHVNEQLEGQLLATGADRVLSKSMRPEVIIASLHELLPATPGGQR